MRRVLQPDTKITEPAQIKHPPKKWRLKEKSDEKLFKGRRTSGSGNKWFDPGDIKTQNLLIESKQTEHESYSLKKKTWEKITHEALMRYKVPIMSIQIQDTEVVVISKADFMKYLFGKIE